MIAQDMKDIASALNLSEGEVCQSFEVNASEWANEIDLAQRFPEVAQLLLRQSVVR